MKLLKKLFPYFFKTEEKETIFITEYGDLDELDFLILNQYGEGW